MHILLNNITYITYTTSTDDTIPGSVRSVTNENFLIFKLNLNIYKNSLIYSKVIIWNNISLDIKLCACLFILACGHLLGKC